MAQIIDYALTQYKDKVNASQMRIIAHSNGVPTLHETLSSFGKQTFGMIRLFAPATGNESWINDIAARSRLTQVIVSDTDRAVGVFNHSSEQWASALQGVSNLEVLRTANPKGPFDSHALTVYIDEMRHGRYQYLKGPVQ
jgi:hypothetical protein